MTKVDIEYNTERPEIQFPEYGRSLQEMIQFAMALEDRYRRQKTVEAIVQLMIQLGPQGNRNMDDYREKLWNHVFAVANYELDVTPPANILIRREEDRPKPQPLGYPSSATRFRHYGNSIQDLIKKAIEMPDGPKKEGFVEVIASYMKLAYKTWNKEHYVSDDVVKDDLEIMSNGLLVLHEGHSSLDILAKSAGKLDKDRNRRPNNNNNGNRNRNNGGNKRNRGNRGGSGGGGGNYNKKRKK